MVELSTTAYARVTRLLRTFDRARGSNPYEIPVMAAPPTVAMSTTADASGTMATAVPMVASNALSPAAQNRVAWYGGKPTVASGAHVGLVVSSAAPASGTGYASANVLATDILLNGAAEIETDSDVVEFQLYGKNDKVVMFQVDGVYVDKTGTAFTSSTTTDHFAKLTLASRKVRRIRAMLSTTTGVGVTFVRSIRVKTNCSFWMPDQSGVLRCGWAGDSYSEGFPYSLGVPNGTWSTLACELLGVRDCRQLAVGGTGYVSEGSPTRKKFSDQVPFWINQAPWDLFVSAHGYNDHGNSSADVQAGVVAGISQIRAAYPSLPIVVLGAQGGVRNLSAGTLAVEAGISAGVSQLNDPLIKFAPVSTDASPWLTGTGNTGATNNSGNSDVYIGPDAVHPSYPAGHEYLALRAANAIRGAVASMLA